LMSLLPCDVDPVAIGVVVVVANSGRHVWDLDGLRAHVSECPRCACLRRAFATMTGSQGGTAGRGRSKRRGGSDYYRALADRQRRHARRCAAP
jgi:hypothetical protein